MTVERTLNDIENEIVDVQNRIDALHKELREQKDKLHSLKENAFEITNNISKGDIIQDTKGVQYCYQGLSQEYGGCFMLVGKITKKGLPSKNTIYLSHSVLKKEKK